MKTDFFSKMKNLLENKNAGMSIGIKDKQMIVSISFQSTTDEDDHSSPIIIKGTPEEMDEGFIEAVTNSMVKVEKVLGLSVNSAALDKQIEEVEENEAKNAAKASAKKKEYKGKPLDAKAKAGIKKVEEYIEQGKFDNAEVHLKSQCDKFLNHPDVVALFEKIKEKQDEAEEEAEENPEGNLAALNTGTLKNTVQQKAEASSKEEEHEEETEETSDTEEAEEVVEEIAEETAKTEEAIVEEQSQPQVKEEPKVLSLSNAFSKQEAPKEEPKIQVSTGSGAKDVISAGFDTEKYKAMDNVDLMKIATDEKMKNNIRKAYDIILCLIEKSPSHPIAKMRKSEYEKLLNL